MVAFSKPMLAALAEPAPRTHEPDRPVMRLVHEEEDHEACVAPVGHIGALKADRRFFPRRTISLRINGRRLDHSIEARREPFLNLQIGDVSIGGLCATSQTALRTGERVAVFFPPEGTSRGWDAYGRVLRVEPQRVGWKVAIAFDTAPAA